MLIVTNSKPNYYIVPGYVYYVEDLMSKDAHSCSFKIGLLEEGDLELKYSSPEDAKQNFKHIIEKMNIHD